MEQKDRNEELNYSLLSDEDGEIHSFTKVIDPPNAIACYNVFVNAYNSVENRVAEIYFKKMEESPIYDKNYQLLKTSAKRFLVLFLCLFIPGITYLFIIFTLLGCLAYEKAYKIYLENEANLKNPFENMIYNPALCSRYNSRTHTYEIEIKGNTTAK